MQKLIFIASGRHGCIVSELVTNYAFSHVVLYVLNNNNIKGYFSLADLICTITSNQITKNSMVSI